MTDEEKPRSAKRPEIVDPNNVPVVFIDCIITGGQNDGNVNMALGTLDSSLRTGDDELPRIVVAARFRCSVEFAKRLHAAMGSILDAAGATSAGPPSAAQTNLIN